MSEAEQRLRDQLASENYAHFTRADIAAVLAELDAAEHALREIAKGPLSGARIIAEETLRQLEAC